VALTPDPARLEAGAEFENYLATVVLGAHLERLPDPERPAFVRAIIDKLSDPVVDYVRLTLRAKKPR
jgi:trans-aconitate 2-methyltransferase